MAIYNLVYMLYNLRLALSIGEIPNDPFMPSTQT